MMRLKATVTLVLVLGCVVRAEQQPSAPDQRPRFDTRADIVLVDVAVTDRDGNPVQDLRPADFTLEVNGDARPIQSVQFVSTVPEGGTAAAAPDTGVSSNEQQTTGRLLLFAVDENNLRFGGGRAVLKAAQELMASFAPGDLIGLARLPDGIGGVEFTTDRERISAALQRVAGKVPARQMGSNLRLNEAWAYENNDQQGWQAAVDRECAGESGFALEACIENLRSDAVSLLVETQARTAQSIRALEGLFTRLRALNAPVQVVLISEGLFTARDRNSLSQVGRLAAEARASMQIVQPGQSFFDIENSSAPTMGFMSNEDLLTEGLDQLAGDTRGARHRVAAGTGAGIFQRISREMSGYYLIGFEPTEADRTGRQRRIKVEVRRRGLTVRGRSTFAIAEDASAAAAAASPEEEVKQLLAAPLPARGLPMRVVSYTATGTEGSSQLRVVISAEIGDEAAEPAEWPVGVMVLDGDDKVVASSLGPTTLQPARASAPSPRLFLTSVLLEPGDYTLRLAAADGSGRSGSVHHSMTARLSSIGPVSVSDLVLAPLSASTDETPRPTPSAPINTETMSAMIEMIGRDPAVLGKTRVSIQVAESATGPALVSADARPASRFANQRAFGTSMKLSLLPPGTYIARAVVSVPGERDTQVLRTFSYAPGKPAPVTSARRSLVEIDVDAPAPPPPPSSILAPVPQFQADLALHPAVVRPFLDGLADLHPPSEDLAPIVDNARNGTFRAPDPDARTPKGDELMLSFIRGLDALQKKQPAQARAWFEQTLKGDSSFLGAAFFLGVAHAAGGRDRDAIGAWQMALLSENPGAVYPLLVDALLRVGDGQGAIEFLEEAPAVWADEDARLRREATALALLGEFDAALPKLQALLATGGADDPNLLFVTIQVMYRRHVDGGLDENERRQFADYVARYDQAGGKDRALVGTWRKFVMK